MYQCFAEQMYLICRLILKKNVSSCYRSVGDKDEAQSNKVFKSKKSNYGIMRIRT